MTDTEDDDRFGNEPEVEEPKKKRRKKRKRGRIITVEDMPRKVREEFRTDQKAEKFLRLLGKIFFFGTIIQLEFWKQNPIDIFKIHFPGLWFQTTRWVMVPHFELCLQDLSIGQ